MLPPAARITVVVLSAALSLQPWTAVHGPAEAAAPPRGPVGVRSARPAPSTVLMEVSTGEVLESTNATVQHPPASLDKLMTLYLTLQAIHAGRLTPDTNVTVSTEAWRIGRVPGSSRMFLNVGDTVTVRQLLEGLMVASGNDAAEALAETVGGSADRFVGEMNATAERFGMRDTHFVTPHGLPAPGEHVSAADMAVLARHVLLEFPEATQYSSPQYESYGGIRQANWNNLVFRDPRVDGLKTGHTEASGYSIVATARDGDLRLVVVVLGAASVPKRTALAEGMLAAGFAHYTVVAVPWQTVVPAALRVYGGSMHSVPLQTARSVTVLVPRGSRGQFEVTEEITARPFAPIARGQDVGTLTVRRNGQVVQTIPLVASAAVDRAGLVGRLWGVVSYAAASLMHRHPVTSRGTYSPPT
ncbi:MAG TPA: D-alanyl-D-alanine carboxypeptidase family protein [bacterium]|nr:D-alanyl-D-alanine carboxypeptidase family protein [bacterium]